MVRHGAASAQRGGVTSWAEGEISVVPAKAGTSQPCGGRFPSFLRRQEPRSPAVGGFRRSCGGRNLVALGLEDGAPIITPSQYPHTQPLNRALARLDSSLRWNDRGRERGSCLPRNDGVPRRSPTHKRAPSVAGGGSCAYRCLRRGGREGMAPVTRGYGDQDARSEVTGPGRPERRSRASSRCRCPSSLPSRWGAASSNCSAGSRSCRPRASSCPGS